ncbi:unnamed protein product [Cunninghamella blakesleeana]
MRITYNDIQPLEKTVLQDQYEDSPFFKKGKHLTTQPTHLEIFDFDSTLFLSPSLSPTLWHPTLIKELVGEDVYGPGWWRDIRSLELGPIDTLEKKQWKGFWNEDIVEKARISLADPSIMTVLLTGRRKVPFNTLISRMVASKQLDFDLLGLRPDPTQEDHDQHIQLTSSESALSFFMDHPHQKSYHHKKKKKTSQSCIVYGAHSIFQDTMDFKTSFILNLLHNVPSIKKITMWDDRLPHVKKFQEYLQELIHLKTILESKVHYVPGIRPKYDPQWESQVVQHIFTSHDANEILFREQQLWNAHIQPLTWDHYIEEQKEKEDDEKEKEKENQPFLNHHFYLTSSSILSSSFNSSTFQYIPLTTLPSNTIIKLSESTKKALKERFEPYYYEQLKKNKKEITGWKANAEIPLWFGDQIILSLEVLGPNQLRRYGGLNKEVQFFIRSISYPHPQLGMVALIRLKPTEDTLKNESAPPPELIRPSKDYILPLIYKPSMATALHYKHYQWYHLPKNNPFLGSGEIAFNTLIGLGATIDNHDNDNTPVLPFKRTTRNSTGERSFTDSQVSDQTSCSRKNKKQKTVK